MKSNRKTTMMHTGKSISHGNNYSVSLLVKTKKFRPIELTQEQNQRMLDQLMASRVTHEDSMLEQVLADNLYKR